MITTETAETPPMFSPEAWEAGWRKAEAVGLTTAFQPMLRPVTMRDVEEIVSAVVNHGFEEIYVEQLAEDGWLKSLPEEAVERMKSHMLRRLAVEVAEHRCVMLTLPRELTDHPEPGIARVRLIVPVRRIG